MPDLLRRVEGLHRPKLLVQAARFARAGSSRTTLRARLLPNVDDGDTRGAVAVLAGLEDEQEVLRREGSAAYSPARHIDLLAALMAEAQVHRSALAGAESGDGTDRLRLTR